jgi:hypothetical protein
MITSNREQRNCGLWRRNGGYKVGGSICLSQSSAFFFAGFAKWKLDFNERRNVRMHMLFRFRIYSALALTLTLLCAFPAPRIQAASKHIACCGSISPAGMRLASVLDSMNVESLWLAHEHVNWETGEPDRGANDEGPGNHTHCSAFAASVAKTVGVYLLRPPQHGQLLLANAQAKWLKSPDAQNEGWQEVYRMEEAPQFANQGRLVVVVFANPDPHVPGHIAIVRPSEKSMRALEENGPQIVQAGNHNHASTNVRTGFGNHPGAFPGGVSYYAHSIR